MSKLPEIGKNIYNYFAICAIKNNNVEEGIECFNHWLSTQEEGDTSIEENRMIQLTLKAFEKEKNKLLLHDNLSNSDIEVVFTDGAPFCSICNVDDCAHTGFAICAKQNLHG